MAVHGFLIVLSCGGLFVMIGRHVFDPEPAPDTGYYDDPTKAGVILAMAWAVFGLFIGVWVASQLAYPELAFDAAWSSFGRMRPAQPAG